MRTIVKYGWEVISVSGGPGPEFAYTVGLPHRAGHPELLMSGLDQGLMHRRLSDLARRVLDGTRFAPGHAVEGVLSGVPVLLERVRPSALATTVVWSRWFHRRRVDALQVVWPDRMARFDWQPGVDGSVRTRQPSSWRVPAGRIGLLAPDPAWPLSTPADEMAVACRHVVEDGAVPVHVERYDERGADAWVIACAADHGAGLTQFTSSHLAHLVRAAPSLAQVDDLPFDAVIERSGPDVPWKVVPG